MTAPTKKFVDESIGTATGTGTIGDPYGLWQHGLDSESHDTTNGTKWCIKDSAIVDLAGTTLTLTLYGTTTFTALAPFIVQGYTTTEGDGGIFRVNCNGATSNGFLGTNATDFVYIYDGEIYGNTSGHTIYLDNNCAAINTEVHDSAGDGIRFGVGAVINACYIHDIAAQGVQVEIGSMISGNRFIAGATKDFGSYAIFMTGYGSSAINNIIDVGSGTASGIGYDLFNTIKHNSIYSDGGTGTGIKGRGTSKPADVSSNLIEGFSGIGGIGILTDATGAFYQAGNSVYNCETEFSTVAERIHYGSGDEVLTASPFTNAAAGDFSPVDVGLVKEGALPSHIGLSGGAASDATYLYRGAINPQCVGGAGGATHSLIGGGGLVH